eukprot:gene34141-44113_t
MVVEASKVGRIEEGDRELGRVEGDREPVGALEAPNCVQVPLQLLIYRDVRGRIDSSESTVTVKRIRTNGDS